MISLLWVCLPAHAAPPLTSEQLQILEQLPPEQREKLLRAIQGNAAPEQETPPPEAAQPQPREPTSPSKIEAETGTAAETKESLHTSSGAEGAGKQNLRQPLRQFGYELFAGVPSTFAPATDIPIPADYVIGPGDTVQVQLFGKENIEHRLSVTREGMLLFPGIGPIQVAGLKFSRLQDLIAMRVQKQFIGVKASVTLGTLRSIRVFVLGDVERPGSYTVSALSTLTNALFVSGGVKKIGSLRNIQLKREGQIISQMDLYNLLLRGDTSGDVRLLPGDVIFVPPLGKTAGIAGEIRRPAIYELKDERAVQDLIAMAGGLLSDAYPQGAQIERIQENRERTVLDTDLSKPEGLHTVLSDGDVVKIYSILDKVERVVFLSGHVQRPGSYQWVPGMRLTDLIPSMLDLLPDVDSRYLLITRENLADRTIELLSADLAAALKEPESDADPELRPRDTVTVFSIQGGRETVIGPLLDRARAQSAYDRPAREVVVSGMVHHPGRYPLVPNMKVSGLLSAAGGLTDSAYTLEARLTRFTTVAGGERRQELLSVDLAGVLREDRGKDLLVAPYDQLVVSRIPKWDMAGTVKIRGEVRFPGEYPIVRGEKLSELLKRAGGLTDEAFPKGAVFLRESVRVREQAHLDRLADQLERDLAVASTQSQDLGKTAVAIAEGRILLQRLRAAKAVGRVAIDLDSLTSGRGDYDVSLQDGDQLHIPQKPDEVTVVGEVYYPTSHLFNKKLGRNDFVRLSGGVSERGNSRAVYVVHADGSVSAPSGWFHRSDRVGPGDTVVVPLKVERISTLKLVTDVTQVLYQLAVSAAALKVLGVF